LGFCRAQKAVMLNSIPTYLGTHFLVNQQSLSYSIMVLLERQNCLEPLEITLQPSTLFLRPLMTIDGR
jgi:hypothetical protein